MNRDILGLVAKFGYVSIREVEYLLDCDLMTAVHRLFYLTNVLGLLQRFESSAKPDIFYCMTPQGRIVVSDLSLSNEINGFVPKDYRWFWQNHHRQSVKCFIAFRKLYGDSFAGWTSENYLRKDASMSRVVDGEFYVKGHGNDHSFDLETCWVEVELSLKSPARYDEQFERISCAANDIFSSKGTVSHLFYLSGDPVIQKKLLENCRLHSWGKCQLHFAQTHEFFKNPKGASFVNVNGPGPPHGSIKMAVETS